MRNFLAALWLVAIALFVRNFWSEYTELQVIEPLKKFELNPESMEYKYRGVIRIVSNSRACSATVVNKMYAITAKHCVVNMLDLIDKDERFFIYDDIGQIGIGMAHAVAVSGNEDVALLIGDFSEFRPIPVDIFGLDAINTNDVLVVCGFPYSQSIIHCTYNYGAGHNTFQIMATGSVILPGMSGGIVLLQRTGKLVAVVSAAYGNYNLFGPIMGVFTKWGISPQ